MLNYKVLTAIAALSIPSLAEASTSTPKNLECYLNEDPEHLIVELRIESIEESISTRGWAPGGRVTGIATLMKHAYGSVTEFKGRYTMNYTHFRLTEATLEFSSDLVAQQSQKPKHQLNVESIGTHGTEDWNGDYKTPYDYRLIETQSEVLCRPVEFIRH
jgi:hypothetical protein